MSELTIVFSPRAKQRLEDIADYLYQQNLSSFFDIDYLNRFETWLNIVLRQFPESVTSMPEFGVGIRRIVYNQYSFVYRIKDDSIEKF